MASGADSSEKKGDGGHVRAFVIGMVAGAALMFFFSGVVVKVILIAALVLIAVALARFL
jgi:hypothetical protein